MSQNGDAVFDNSQEEPIIDEIVRSGDDRTPVQSDERTVSDETEDFIFTSKHRRKRRSSHHRSASEDETDTAKTADDTPLLMSTRERSDHRHHHHHHHHHHHRRSGKKKMKTWKKVLLIIGCVFLSLVILAVTTVAILLNKGNGELYDDEVNIVQPENITAEIQEQGKYIVYKGENYVRNENVTSILFMGVDNEIADDRVAGTAGQADAIAVIALDFKKGKGTLIAVPRDTITDIAIYSVGGAYTGMKKQQLCLAYAYGDGKEKSCQNVLASVKNIFYNIPINSYFAIDLDGVTALNDAVGGVDVVSPENIGSFKEGKSYHLEGDLVQSFVRTRRMDIPEASTLRLQRQEVYAKEYLKKIISATKKDITTPITLFNTSAPYSCTNLNPSKISVLAKELVTGKGMDFDFTRATGTLSLDQDNHASITLDEQKFFELFLSVYYEKMPAQGATTAQ